MVLRRLFSRTPLVPLLFGLALSEPASAKVDLSRGELAGIAAQASRRVDALVPDLSDATLTSQLRRLAKQGRTVRLLVAGKALQGQDGGKRAAQLANAGVALRYLDNEIFDAFVLADGPHSRRASGDLTVLAVRTGRPSQAARLLTFTQEGDYALAYQHEFEGLWQRARSFGGDSKSQAAGKRPELRNAGGPFALFSSDNMTPVRLPDGSWSYSPTLAASTSLFGDYLTGAMDYAYASIDIGVVGRLDRPELLQAMHRALSRGVRVRLLLEEKVSADIQTLAARGATVVSLAGLAKAGKTARLPGNAVVIDGKTVLTGTFRWSAGAERQAFASLVSLQGPVVGKYTRWLEYGFKKAGGMMPQVITVAAE